MRKMTSSEKTCCCFFERTFTWNRYSKNAQNGCKWVAAYSGAVRLYLGGFRGWSELEKVKRKMLKLFTFRSTTSVWQKTSEAATGVGLRRPLSRFHFRHVKQNLWPILWFLENFGQKNWRFLYRILLFFTKFGS
jgi:hypothetical protein